MQQCCTAGCRMTITVSNSLGGQKEGDSAYTYGTPSVSYGFRPQTFTSDSATKQAQFQFDFERPTHCLLENDIPDVVDRSANCTVFPIALDEDITSVFLHIFCVVRVLCIVQRCEFDCKFITRSKPNSTVILRIFTARDSVLCGQEFVCLLMWPDYI